MRTTARKTSGTLGHMPVAVPFMLVPSNQKVEETRLFAWLNGRPFGPRSHQSAKAGGAGSPQGKQLAETKEEGAARSRVLNKILPLLYSLADVVNPERDLGPTATATSSKRQKRIHLKQLNGVLGKYRLFCHCELDGGVYPYASGLKVYECWVMWVLVCMWKNGRLNRIGRCECGCHRLIMKWRADRRFFQDSCSVQWHQRSLDFKEKRNERARQSRKLEKSGIIHVGLKKERARSGQQDAAIAKDLGYEEIRSSTA